LYSLDASIKTPVPRIFVFKNIPGFLIELSTCDSAAKLITQSNCSFLNKLNCYK